jgi:membrane carboxypeptidase/penicillin-binding protein PbpC
LLDQTKADHPAFPEMILKTGTSDGQKHAWGVGVPLIGLGGIAD